MKSKYKARLQKIMTSRQGRAGGWKQSRNKPSFLLGQRQHCANNCLHLTPTPNAPHCSHSARCDGVAKLGTGTGTGWHWPYLRYFSSHTALTLEQAVPRVQKAPAGRSVAHKPPSEAGAEHPAEWGGLLCCCTARRGRYEDGTQTNFNFIALWVLV